MCLVSCSEYLFLPLLAVTESGGIASTHTAPRLSSSKYSRGKNPRLGVASRRGEAKCSVSQIVKIHKKSIGRIKWAEARRSESLPLYQKVHVWRTWQRIPCTLFVFSFDTLCSTSTDQFAQVKFCPVRRMATCSRVDHVLHLCFVTSSSLLSPFFSFSIEFLVRTAWR